MLLHQYYRHGYNVASTRTRLLQYYCSYYRAPDLVATLQPQAQPIQLTHVEQQHVPGRFCSRSAADW
eukprot:3417175-Rhodomonas_salina.2